MVTIRADQPTLLKCVRRSQGPHPLANRQYIHPNAIRVSTDGDELGRPPDVAYPRVRPFHALAKVHGQNDFGAAPRDHRPQLRPRTHQRPQHGVSFLPEPDWIDLFHLILSYGIRDYDRGLGDGERDYRRILNGVAKRRRQQDALYEHDLLSLPLP